MIIQRPTTESNWLYKDVNEDRWFTKEACLPDWAPELPECTNEEKEAYEREHSPEVEPEPSSEQTEESVEQPTE